ncbi:hypothetical protein [Chondromyces apiculatus]|nr:hypothetical protein [Chondromyces apiculatus]
MNTRSRALTMSLSLLALLAGRPAAAQEPPAPAATQDLAAAEALFDKGVTELEAGHYETACPALAESQRLDPRPGTLFALADCQDKAGKVATAAALYADYLRAVEQLKITQRLRHDKRAKMAQARQEQLAALIPELTLVLPESAPNDVLVTRDGVTFSGTSLGMALPLDPGEHVVTTRVGEGPVVEQRVTLAAGEKRVLEIQVKRAEKASPPAPAAVPKPRVTMETPVELGSGAMSGRRIGALVAGGVGVAGLALGGVTGLMALSKKSVVQEHCTGAVCDPEGKEAADAAKVPGVLSTVGFGVGAVGIATGLVLWLTEPSSTKVGGTKRGMQAMVDAGPEGAALGVKGVW